jgi:hypothetical protein
MSTLFDTHCRRGGGIGSEVLELWVAFKTVAVQWLKSHRSTWLIRDTRQAVVKCSQTIKTVNHARGAERNSLSTHNHHDHDALPALPTVSSSES